MGDIIFYEEVPLHTIPQKKQIAVFEMRKFCQKDLKLPELKIIWARRNRHYRQYPGGRLFELKQEVKGCAYLRENVIMLNADIPQSEIVMTTAHECRHFYQLLNVPDYPGTCDLEKDADIYASQADRAFYMNLRGETWAFYYTGKEFAEKSV